MKSFPLENLVRTGQPSYHGQTYAYGRDCLLALRACVRASMRELTPARVREDYRRVRTEEDWDRWKCCRPLPGLEPSETFGVACPLGAIRPKWLIDAVPICTG